MTTNEEYREAGARLRQEKPPDWMPDYRPAADRDPKALLDRAAAGRDAELSTGAISRWVRAARTTCVALPA